MGAIRIAILTGSGQSRTLEFKRPEDLYPRQGITCPFCTELCQTVGALITHVADNCGETDLERAQIGKIEDRGHL